MLWLAGNAGLFTAYETGNSLHPYDADGRGDYAERDGDPGARNAIRDVDRVAPAAGGRDPGRNSAGRGAAAGHGVVGNACVGPDFRSKE